MLQNRTACTFFLPIFSYLLVMCRSSNHYSNTLNHHLNGSVPRYSVRFGIPRGRVIINHRMQGKQLLSHDSWIGTAVDPSWAPILVGILSLELYFHVTVFCWLETLRTAGVCGVSYIHFDVHQNRIFSRQGNRIRQEVE